jgi:hypothetical protein
MRAITVSDEEPAARRPSRSPLRLAVVTAAYIAPFALLCLRLHGEMEDGTLPLDGSAVLIRFIVVGAFSLLLARWVKLWLRGS